MIVAPPACELYAHAHIGPAQMPPAFRICELLEVQVRFVNPIGQVFLPLSAPPTVALDWHQYAIRSSPRYAIAVSELWGFLWSCQ